MLEHRWDAFTIYVNAYYAVQEAYDSARRSWERPASGLKEFCQDANPFLWDQDGSAEPSLYESFCEEFGTQAEEDTCSAQTGRDVARTWLASLEGERYGTSLVTALDTTANEHAWEEACNAVAKQLASRRARIELSPQDEPAPAPEPSPKEPTQADIETVIALLAKGDEEFAAQLRARLESDD